jgi:ribosomal protein S18 acetylase RimI-like enzyme
LKAAGAWEHIARPPNSLAPPSNPAQDQLSMTEFDQPLLERKASLSVRRADPSDIEALADIEARAFASDRLSVRRLKAFVAAPSAALLVAQGETVLGYALVNFRRGSRTARLYSLAVSPGASGRGIGSRLLMAAERAASERGADRMRLEVRSDNTSALGFYRGKGYLLFGRSEDYYADGMAALRLERFLTLPDAQPPPAAAYQASEAVADG